MRDSKTFKITVMKSVKNIQRNCTKGRFQFSFIMLVALLFTAVQIKSQIPKELQTGYTVPVTAGNLVTQFMGAIKPSSFTGEWASGGKSNWLSTVGKITSTPGLIEGVTSLAAYIKPSMFKEAFKPADLLPLAAKAKSMADAAGLLKTLEQGIKPEAMNSNWASTKTTWLSTLNLLK